MADLEKRLQFKEASMPFYEKFAYKTYEKEGQITVDKEKFELKFDYEQISEKELESLKNKLVVNQETRAEDLKEIINFLLKEKESGQELNLKKILPKDYRVFFMPEREVEDSSVHLPTKNIFVGNDPLSVANIYTMFHEIGHADEYEGFTKTQKKSAEVVYSVNAYLQGQKTEEMPPAEGDLEKMLRLERNAHSFALNKLRPFIKALGADPKLLVNTFVHGNQLATYTEAIREELKKRESMI